MAPWKTVLATALFTAGLISAESAIDAHTKISQVTWTVDVSPIIQARCARCHVANGFGPMSLTSYDEARTWAKAIREEVLSGRMPPWKAAAGYGDFVNDARLTPIEIDLLVSWADGATPLGASAAPSPVNITSAVDRSDIRAFDLPTIRVSGGTTERFEVATREMTDRWITSWEFTPGNRSVVEGATLWIAPGTRVGSWTPLDSAVVFPPGTGERLGRGSRLIMEVRYRKTSETQVDRSRLNLHLASRPLRQVHQRSFSCGTSKINTAIEALAIRPLASGAGESVEVVAKQPDESIEPMVLVPRYAPSYATTYRLRKPVRLAAGTQLTVRSSSGGCSADLEFLSR